MFYKSGTKSQTVLILLLTGLLSGCATSNSDVSCPSFPVPKRGTATELERICPVPARDCPLLSDWLSRLKKLQAQLEVE